MGAQDPSARTTDTSSSSAPASVGALVYWLVVFRAPDAAIVGTRLRAAGLVIGRDTRETFRGDRKLSRQHAELVETEAGLEIVDLGSRNGTRVRGATVARKRLEVGDYVEVGSFGFVVARARELRQLDEDDALVGDSHPFQKVLAEIRSLAASRANALVYGPAGTGRTLVCERVHLRSRPEAAIVWLDARATEEMVAAMRAPRSILERAEGGTLVVECVDEASAATREGLPVLFAAAERAQCRVLSTAADPAAAGRFGATGTWALELPSLDERRDDLPALVAHFARRIGVDVDLSSAEHAALATRAYPGNVKELFALVERLARTEPEERGTVLGLGGTVGLRSHVVRIARSGSRFDAGGTRVDLATSPRLAAVLGALVEAHGTERGSIDAEVIAQKAWPGERIIPRAARNRVYVAVSSLRKLGLRGVIAHANEGYALTGDFVLADDP